MTKITIVTVSKRQNSPIAKDAFISFALLRNSSEQLVRLRAAVMAFLVVFVLLILNFDATKSQTSTPATRIITIPAITTISTISPEEADILRRMPGNCTTGQFDCGEKCIPIKRFRDCHEDCIDGSDEVCWSGFVRCLPTETGCGCVKTADANLLCPNRIDSKFCSLPSSTIFRCKNGNCVPSSWVGDRSNDCGDWSDEQQLTALEPLH